MPRIRNIRKRKNANTKPSYEALEPKQLLATLTVTTVSDVADGSLDGEVSLREAIIATNTNAAFGDAPAGDLLHDRIEFDASLLGQTITLSGSELSITEKLTIRAEDAGVTIDANSESRVFAIATDQDVFLKNLTITNGVSEFGSGVHLSGGGTLRLFDSNVVSNGDVFSVGSGGGGVYNVGSTLVLNGSTFESNNSTFGGGIYSEGDVLVFDSVFEGNGGSLQATGVGGAIRMEAGDLFVSNSAFERNFARHIWGTDGGTGGAIAIAGHDTTEEGSTSFIVDSTFDDNSSRNGGAIANGQNNSLIIHDSVFTSNSASGYPGRYAPTPGDGGAIYNQGSLRLVDVSFAENSSGAGGAVYSTQNTFFNRVDFKNNSAGFSGGAVAVSGNARFYDTTFGGDNAEDGNHSNTTVYAVFGNGGALYIFDSPAEEAEPTFVTVIGGEFKNNSAGRDGGAIFVGTGTTLYVLAGTQIESNAALPRYLDTGTEISNGGAIANHGTTLLSSVSIENNPARTYGGGIYTEGDLTMINSSVSANQAQKRGGGIDVAGGSATLYSTTIGGDSSAEGNFAGIPLGSSDMPDMPSTSGRGGGVSVSGGAGTRFQMNSGRVSFNSATISGGGIFNLDKGVVRFDNGVQVTNNQALSGDGGGAYNHVGHFEVRDAVFEGNTAQRGAGFFNNFGSVSLTNSTLIGNTASGEAGGLYNRWYFGLNASSVTGNFAPEFPNIFDETA